MDRQIARLKKRIAKKAKRGFRGYPVATLVYYGPDDRRASKVVVAIIEHENGEATEMHKWYSEQGDVRDELQDHRKARRRWDGGGLQGGGHPPGPQCGLEVPA